jgi:hypothetical protein
MADIVPFNECGGCPEAARLTAESAGCLARKRKLVCSVPIKRPDDDGLLVADAFARRCPDRVTAHASEPNVFGAERTLLLRWTTY